MNAPAPARTQDRILEAAEILFAQRGFDGTSLRDITDAADANLAAVNYHFGDKAELYKTVLTRRIRPINTARMAALEAAEQQPTPPSLRTLLDILVRPVFELCSTSPSGPYVARIIGRSFAEPLPFMPELFAAEFQPLLARFGGAVRRGLPQLPPDEFMWRLSFVIGSLHHTLSTLHRMGELSRGICRSGDHEGALRRFLDFAVAGLTAPAPNTSGSEPAATSTPLIPLGPPI